MALTDAFRRKMERLLSEPAQTISFHEQAVAADLEQRMKDAQREREAMERQTLSIERQRRMDDLMKSIIKVPSGPTPLSSAIFDQHRGREYQRINLESEGRMQKHTPCDVVVSHDQRVYVNGNEIGWVTDIEFSQDMQGPELILRMRPTSFTQGQPPREQLEAMVEDQDEETVNVNKAMKRIRERKAARKVVGKDTP